jgi:hypothetical protein
MGTSLVPKQIHDRYLVDERRHACAILATDFPDQYKDIVDCLNAFVLAKREIIVGGGGKSKIANRFDDFLVGRKWAETKIVIGRTIATSDGRRDIKPNRVGCTPSKVAHAVRRSPTRGWACGKFHGRTLHPARVGALPTWSILVFLLKFIGAGCAVQHLSHPVRET